MHLMNSVQLQGPPECLKPNVGHSSIKKTDLTSTLNNIYFKSTSRIVFYYFQFSTAQKEPNRARQF